MKTVVYERTGSCTRPIELSGDWKIRKLDDRVDLFLGVNDRTFFGTIRSIRWVHEKAITTRREETFINKCEA